jgi:hypothetical protein
MRLQKMRDRTALGKDIRGNEGLIVAVALEFRYDDFNIYQIFRASRVLSCHRNVIVLLRTVSSR